MHVTGMCIWEGAAELGQFNMYMYMYNITHAHTHILLSDTISNTHNITYTHITMHSLSHRIPTT